MDTRNSEPATGMQDRHQRQTLLVLMDSKLKLLQV
jgi:hypothetical protein